MADATPNGTTTVSINWSALMNFLVQDGPMIAQVAPTVVKIVTDLMAALSAGGRTAPPPP